MSSPRRLSLDSLQAVFADLFGLGRSAMIGVLVLSAVAVAFAAFWFVHSAPPGTLVITAGPPGSVFEKNAARYAKILARSHVKLKILPSQGSLENLQRLGRKHFRVDVGFIQGGETKDVDIERLVSLGSLYQQPVLVFYRGPASDKLAQFEGRRIAVGPEGSGGRALALTLLAASGIKPGGKTKLESLEAEDAAKALLDGRLDAAFMMGDFASPELMRRLLHDSRLRLLSFSHAETYVRRFPYLNRMVSPRGSIDLAHDVPPQDVQLVGPTVELVAREGLHPALCDLLLETAREVHGGASVFRRQGEFPAPQEHEFPLSPDALRYYRSGKTLLYRSLPFRIASLVNRVLVVFVPLLVVLVPGLKVIPAIYRWRVNMRILRWYRSLLGVEQEMAAHLEAADRGRLLTRLDEIETAVNRMKIPIPYANQFYDLRGHIDLVRRQLLAR